jgi:RNA polymerase sigma-70 factor (sigma-E family)
VEASVQDDDAVFAAFVHAYSGALFKTAFLLTGGAGDAEELLQETLARLYAKWWKVAAADNPLAYVRRALANAFVSQRRRPRSQDVSLSQLLEAVDERDPYGVVADRDLLWRLLGALSARQRAAVVLRYFHDLSDVEIAAVLGCRVTTARSLISRGMAVMRKGSAGMGEAVALGREGTLR